MRSMVGRVSEHISFPSFVLHQSLKYIALVNIYPGRFGSIQTFIHDFEDAIINSVKRHFPAKHHSGCHFHIKQALVKKMEEFGFDSSFIHDRFLPLFDFLIVIDHMDIEIAVEYIRREAKKGKAGKEYKEQIDAFLEEYWKVTWGTQRMIGMWNFTGREDWQKEMYVPLIYVYS